MDNNKALDRHQFTILFRTQSPLDFGAYFAAPRPEDEEPLKRLELRASEFGLIDFRALIRFARVVRFGQNCKRNRPGMTKLFYYVFATGSDLHLDHAVPQDADG